MSILDSGECYKSCNETFGMTDARRLYCKKACDSDGDLAECKNDFCSTLCVKSAPNEDLGSWSKWFARAPGTDTSVDCLEACFHGCKMKPEEDD
jgi:hypothetical protein